MATNDMFMDDGSQFAYSRTTDAEGNKISFENPNGIISWLSLQTNEKAENGKELSFFEKLIAFITDLMNKILGMFGL